MIEASKSAMGAERSTTRVEKLLVEVRKKATKMAESVLMLPVT